MHLVKPWAMLYEGVFTFGLLSVTLNMTNISSVHAMCLTSAKVTVSPRELRPHGNQSELVISIHCDDIMEQ